MFTCTKLYSDLPFAHRQHNHDGHCAQIHGHNWSFEFVFTANGLDENYFVTDFGKLKWLKEWLNNMFDHTLLLNQDDPELSYLRECLQSSSEDFKSTIFANIRVVPNCGAEGLALFVHSFATKKASELSNGRVRVLSVTVHEDSKNKATYSTI